MAPSRRISSRRGTNKRTPPATISSIIKCILFIAFTSLFASYCFINSSVDDGDANKLSAATLQRQEEEISPAKVRRGNVEQILIEGTEKEVKAPQVTTIGYAISLTGCPSDPKNQLGDGAAVLAHSIHLNSIQTLDPTTNKPKSKYDYQMYAIVHPGATPCSSVFTKLGYKIIQGDDPVPVSEIQGDFLRENVVKNGCCGEKEFVKLHAYRITDHPIVVHLDLDVLVIQPFDDLFDVMVEKDGEKSEARDKLPVMFDKEVPNRVDAYFTRDYNMVWPQKKYKPVQGGFLALRPSIDAYNTFVDIIRKGHYTKNGGWGDLGFGPYYGSMTFQGIIPYYYDAINPNTAVEVSRCIYNQMCDNPRTGRTVNDIVSGDCRTGEDECEDCRSRPFEDVKSAHFTLCQKPWECLAHDADRIQSRLCKKLITEWFRVRSDLEMNRWNSGKEGKGGYKKDMFYGYCTSGGGKGYIPIEIPTDIK